MPSKKSPRKSAKNKRQTKKSPKIHHRKKYCNKSPKLTKRTKSQSLNNKRKNNRKYSKSQKTKQLGGYVENENTGAMLIEPSTSPDGDLGLKDTVPQFPDLEVCTIL